MSADLGIHHLKTYFYTVEGPIKAVDDVCAEVPKGKTVGIIGESGSGKSTLALSVVRLLPKPGKTVDGQILFKGKNLLDLSEEEMRNIRGRDIGFIFQDPSSYLNPVFKIGDQMTEILRSKKSAKDRDNVINMLRRLQVHSPETMVDSYPHELSSGMKQRIVIGTFFLAKPSILIADEPTTALDTITQAHILKIIKEMTGGLDTSALFITHDLGITAQMCDYVYIMYAGKLLENADTLSIFEDPLHPYTQALLRVAVSKDEKKELSGIEGFVPSLLNPPPGCRFYKRCKMHMPICTKKQPPSIEISPGHMVSCWLFDGC